MGDKWRSVKLFDLVQSMGSGTYSDFFRAINKETKEVFVLKRIKSTNEAKCLLDLHKHLVHPNIRTVNEVVLSPRGGPFLVLEYLDYTLDDYVIYLRSLNFNHEAREIENKKEREGEERGMEIDVALVNKTFSEGSFDLTSLPPLPSPSPPALSLNKIRCLMRQLLSAVYHCHQNNIVLKDIRPSHILVNKEGFLKLSRFEQAVRGGNISHGSQSKGICYLPPESLLCIGDYNGPEGDIWAVGCIFVELLLGRPLFAKGQDELSQLAAISRLCGPLEDVWPESIHSLHYDSLLMQGVVAKGTREEKGLSYKSSLHDLLKNTSSEVIVLIENLLCVDPKKRVTAYEALHYKFFTEDPIPCSIESCKACSEVMKARGQKSLMDHCLEFIKDNLSGFSFGHLSLLPLDLQEHLLVELDLLKKNDQNLPEGYGKKKKEEKEKEKEKGEEFFRLLLIHKDIP